ncbi:MAG: hypothetical protein MZV64_41245 [Ignavibacteriales bacterium]|nr:hypothetical protein [Ignavibacteriales bacterium]
MKKNADHFDLFEFILQLNNWYKLKLKTQILIQNILKENSMGNESEIANLIDENIRALNSLKQNYSKLWLNYYKESNLNMIEDKFDRLILYFQEIKENLLSKILSLTSPGYEMAVSEIRKIPQIPLGLNSLHLSI